MDRKLVRHYFISVFKGQSTLKRVSLMYTYSVTSLLDHEFSQAVNISFYSFRSLLIL